MKRGVLPVLAVAGVATAAAAALTGGLVSKPAPQIAASSSSDNGGRTFLTSAQLIDARAKGALDRPVNSLLNVPQRMHYGDFAWDDRNVPQGSVWVRVDLGRQLISVFRAGHEIGTAVILYGADGKQTPSGTFPILAKIKDHESSTYDARMPFTLRLTDDGVSIHASDVRWGAATHGCIGVPPAFAEKLFDQVAKDDQVVIVPDRSQLSS